MTRLLTEDEVAEIREDRAFDSDACDAPRDGDPRCDRTGPPVDCCDACVLVLLLDSHTAQASRIAESERRRGGGGQGASRRERKHRSQGKPW